MPSILNATTTTGLVSSADNSGSLQLQTNNGTTAVTIDTSQNVGIGTSSPSEKLSVTGNVTATGTNTSATYFHRSIAPATESNIETSLITTGNGANQRAGLFATNDYNNTLATELIFKTNATTGGATERMRITSGGNFQFNSGYGSVATAYGCRAWVNFNGTGTVAIRASGNVSSITDNGSGDYTVNFTNAMPDTNYSISGAARYGDSAGSTMRVVTIASLNSLATDMTTSSIRILSAYVNGGQDDNQVVCMQVFR